MSETLAYPGLDSENTNSMRAGFQETAVKYLDARPDVERMCEVFEKDKRAEKINQKVFRERAISPHGAWCIFEKASIEDLQWHAHNFDEDSLVDGNFRLDNSEEVIYTTLKHLFDKFGKNNIDINISRDIGYHYTPSPEEKLEINAILTYVLGRLGGQHTVDTILNKTRRLSEESLTQ